MFAVPGDPVGGGGRGVQAQQPGDGGTDVGLPQEQAHHELRETQPRAPILLRWRHDRQGQIGILLAVNYKLMYLCSLYMLRQTKYLKIKVETQSRGSKIL